MNGYNTDDDAHVCAISKGDLYCWGRTNYYGQIGSFREDTSVPQKVENVSIAGNDSFEAEDFFFPTDKVIITYH